MTVVQNVLRRFSAALLVWLSGCAAHKGWLFAQEPPSRQALAGAPEAPYKISVTHEWNDGDVLEVNADVISAVQWRPQDVVVTLSCIRSGETRGQATATIAELSREETPVAPGVTVPLTIRAPAAGATDYQLQLLWGQDAKEALADAPGQGARLENLSVNAEEVSCAQLRCPVRFAIAADLVNEGARTISQVMLGVGFVWVKEDQEMPSGVTIPAHEEQVALDHLDLAPGRTRPVKLTIARPIAWQEGGRYVPVVRIIS